MNLKDIKKDYLKKIKKINELNENYYDKNISIVSDGEYDNLKKEHTDPKQKRRI